MPADHINPWRGEVALVLGDTTYCLRPSFAALCAIEQRLNCGIYALARQLAARELPLEALKTIIRLCSTQDMPDAAWEEALLHGGLRACLEAVTQLFTLVLEGFGRG